MFPIESAIVKTQAQTGVRVLAMKLQLPNLPLDLVKRENVLKQLQQDSLGSQIFLFQAGAGFGKSLTLSQWFYLKKYQKQNVAWLTLDPKENLADRFVTYLSCALNSADRTLGLPALAAIEQGESAEAVFQMLMVELSTYSTVLHLALDDIHHLHEPEVLDFLDQLMHYLPANVFLYLTSREKIKATYARLMNQDKLKLIDESTLAFNWDESKNWLQKKYPKIESKVIFKKIYELSEGWVTGLNLLYQIHPQINEALELSIRGDERILIDYFSQEWAKELSEQEIKICEQLAILTSADHHYLNAVFNQVRLSGNDFSAPEEYSGSMLQDLADRHLLLDRLPAKNSWLKPHKMLALYLFQKINKKDIQAIYMQASRWLYSQGEGVLAVEMALKSGNELEAANLLQKTAESILEKQDIAQLLLWKKQLPADVIAASPRLIIIFSWTFVLAQQFDEAERLMAKMDRFLTSGKISDDEFSGPLFAIRAYIARNRGNIDTAIQLCEKALDKLPTDNYVARAITYFNLSNAYMTQDKLHKAREFNVRSFETARAAGSLNLEMLAIHEHARIEQVKGNLNLSLKLLQQGLDLANSLENKKRAAAYGRLLIYKGYILWLMNKTDEAEVYLHEGIQVAERCHDSYLIMGFVILSQLQRQRGHLEKAFDELSRCEAQLQRWSVPASNYQPWLNTMRINLNIDQGRRDEAVNRLNSMYGLLEGNPYALSPEHYPALRNMLDVFSVRVKSLAGNHKDALKFLNEKLNNSGQLQQGFSLIFIYLMRSLLRFQLGDEDDAMQDFRLALKMAQDNNCIMPFIEYSTGMTALYKRLPLDVQQQPFVQSILKSIVLNDSEDHNQAFAKARSVISQRELGVLKLIAQGLSNQAIAERLYISLHTVKTHARRINAKLEVKSRTQAIIKAREIGLI